MRMNKLSPYNVYSRHVTGDTNRDFKPHPPRKGYGFVPRLNRGLLSRKREPSVVMFSMGHSDEMCIPWAKKVRLIAG